MRLAIFAIVLLFAGVAAAQDTPPTASIGGQLINVATGQPIPGADVSYWVGSKEVDTKTDDAGRYKFTGLTPGAGHIKAEAPMPSMPGFGASARRYLTLAAGQDLTGIDVRIRPYGEISGKVLDENKEPIPGMPVYLLAREYSSGSLRYIYDDGNVHYESAWNRAAATCWLRRIRSRNWMRFPIRRMTRACASALRKRRSIRACRISRRPPSLRCGLAKIARR